MKGRILQLLSPYTGQKVLIQQHQSVADIMKAIISAHKEWAFEYDKIYKIFERGTINKTAREIFSFLKNNVRYNIEPEAMQTVKSPAAIVATGNPTGSDCKCYALFIGGVLDAINRNTGSKIKWCYRFTSYNFNPEPQHVFVVINPGSENEIFVDPVLNYFNERKSYFFKIDKTISMALYKVSGVQQQNVAGLFDWIKKTIVTVAALPARTAFLILVRVNFKNFAKDLDAAKQRDAAKVEAWWRALGGDNGALQNAINDGRTKKMLGNVPANVSPSAKVGEVTLASIAAAITAATPVVIAVVKLLKEMNIQQVQPPLTDGELQNYLQQNSPGGSLAQNSWFESNKGLLIGGAALVGGYFLFIRKK